MNLLKDKKVSKIYGIGKTAVHARKMRSYLSLIPISAKVHRRKNRMTLLCIIFAVFMVTAIFSMAEMGVRMEQSRLAEKHGDFSLLNSLLNTTMGQTLAVITLVTIPVIIIYSLFSKQIVEGVTSTGSKEG